MKKTHWFTLALAMVLLVPFLAMAEGELAQPASAGTSAAALESPIVGPLLDIWSDAVNNLEPAVAYNILHDEYLVVWWNDRGATRDIYARRVGSDGTLKSWVAVATGPGQWRWSPAVAYSRAQDEYLIVYTYWDSGMDYDLYARRVKWDGSWMSSEFVIKDDVGWQYMPAVAYNSQDDEYLVVYENWWLGAGLRDIAAQRVRASDGFLLSWANVATGVGESRTSPDVAYNPDRNQYLIAYDYYHYSNSGREDIHGKVAVASLAGVSVSPEINISDTTNSSYIWEGVAAGPDEYLVVWREHLGPIIAEAYGRRVSGDGALLGSAGGFPIATGTFDGFDTFDPMAVAYGAGYGYLVTSSYVNSQSWWVADVYGRYVMPGQDEATGEEFPIDDSPNTQVPWGVACAPSGDCLVVEEHNALPHPGENYEIRGRFVMPPPSPSAYRVYLPLVLRNFTP